MSPERKTELEKALSRCKIAMMHKSGTVFIANICFALRHQFSEEIPTAAVDGVSIFYNPEFFMSLKIEEQIGLMLHETWHVVFGHVGEMSRLGDRCPKKWNRAGDYVINWLLVESGITIPPGGLCDRKYSGMSTEEVYNKLPDDPEDDFECDLLPNPKGDKEAQKDLENMIIRGQIQAMKANDVAKEMGAIPGNIRIYLDKLLNPKLPWRTILRNFLTAKIKSDYSYRRPNRKFLPDIYIPTALSDGLGNIAMAIDMSGSVTPAQISQFIADVTETIQTMKPKSISLVQFDTQIISVDEIKSVHDLNKIEFSGGGGTDIADVINWAKKKRPAVICLFTDGWLSQRHLEDPKVPVIWLVHNNPDFTGVFGKTIHYEIEN